MTDWLTNELLHTEEARLLQYYGRDDYSIVRGDLAEYRRQNEYWVDRYGTRHWISSMSAEYVRNVLGFLHREYPTRFDFDNDPLILALRERLMESE